MKIKKGEIAETQNAIIEIKKNLKQFIDDKDNFYKSVKKNREANNK